MFLVTYITRTQSSGFESRNNKTFDTLEQAAEYIQGTWYESFCELNYYPDEWDEEDLGRPMPTRDDFSLDVIKKAMSKKFWSGTLFDPYSQYCGHVPNELHLTEVNEINNTKKALAKEAAEPVVATLAKAVAIENALVEKDKAYLAAARAVVNMCGTNVKD
jgi:hypothetical protein